MKIKIPLLPGNIYHTWVVRHFRYRPRGGGGGGGVVTMPGFVCRKVKEMGPFSASSE